MTNKKENAIILAESVPDHNRLQKWSDSLKTDLIVFRTQAEIALSKAIIRNKKEFYDLCDEWNKKDCLDPTNPFALCARELKELIDRRSDELDKVIRAENEAVEKFNKAMDEETDNWQFVEDNDWSKLHKSINKLQEFAKTNNVAITITPCKKKPAKALKQAIKERDGWSARDSKCPICKHHFYSTRCNHSVREAIVVLDARVAAAAQEVK